MFRANFRMMELVREDGCCGVNGTGEEPCGAPGRPRAYGRYAYNFPRFRDPRMIWVTV
jgi:hypothetical protein